MNITKDPIKKKYIALSFICKDEDCKCEWNCGHRECPNTGNNNEILGYNCPNCDIYTNNIENYTLNNIIDILNDNK